jgi:hypothetical protein
VTIARITVAEWAKGYRELESSGDADREGGCKWRRLLASDIIGFVTDDPEGAPNE